MPGSPQNPAAQNSGGTAKKVGKPFPKGKSGNPGGRPKGAAAAREYIASKTDDGRRIIDFHVDVMDGKPIKLMGPDGDWLEVVPSIQERHGSAKELADRFWGKSVQATEISGAEGEPLSFQIIRKVAK